MTKSNFQSILLALLDTLIIGQMACRRTDKVHQREAEVAQSAEAYPSLTPDGAWCWFSDPRAIYFEGEHQRTYAGWISSIGDITVAYHDHQTGKISTFVLHEKFEVDDHDHPVLQISKEGYLTVYFSKHGPPFPIQCYRSSNPEDITAWEEPMVLKLNDMEAYAGMRDSYTYQHPVYLSDEDRYFLFWRGADLKPNYSISETGGKTWSKGRILILPERIYKNRRPYLKVSSNGKDKIHFAFTDGHPNIEKENSIYYMYYQNGSLFKPDRSVIRPLGDEPVSPREASVVYDATEDHNPKAWVWDVAEGRDGSPVIAYAKIQSDTVHLYSYARWDGTAWQNHELINSGGYFPEDTPGQKQTEPEYSGGMAIDHENTDVVYLSVNRLGIFEIEKWELTNGVRWETSPVTQGSVQDNVRPVAVRNAGEGNPLQVLWMNLDHYRHYTDYHAAIKMDR